MKSFLVINSNHHPSKLIAQLFKKLEDQGHFFHIMSSNPDLLEWFDKTSEERVVKKIRSGPDLDSRSGLVVVTPFLPLVCLKQFITLFYIKFFKKVDAVICFDSNDRVVFTPIARVLRMRVVWWERPDVDHSEMPKFLLKLLRSLSRSVDKIIVLNQRSREILESKGFKPEKIKNIRFGISPTQEHQDDMFSNLARKGYFSGFQDCFSIGVITDLDNVYQIENLFQSIKVCLDVFTNLRVIIIGDGKEKKKVSWLARRNGIENLIYLVGDQKDLEKWWDSFDVYLAWMSRPRLYDFQIALEAMASGLPVIAFRDRGWKELVRDGETGFLVQEGDSEELAQKFIRLQQYPELKKKMGTKASELVKNNFTFSQQLQRLAQEL